MSSPEPLQPVYDFSVAPKPVSLFHGSAELDLGGERRLSGEGEVLLQFSPRPRVIIEAMFQESDSAGVEDLFFSESDTPSFTLNGEQIKGFSTKRGMNDDGMYVIWNSRFETMEFGDMRANTAVAAISHLFNFPDFHAGQQQADAPAGCCRLVLESEEWRIDLQSLPNRATFQAWERIREEGGCFLTHVVKLARKDGAAFSGNDAKEQHSILTNLLSFVKGEACKAVCQTGLDITGARTWQTFASPLTSSNPMSWFEKLQGHQAETLFPLFVTKWQQSDAWRDCLRHAIYWYSQANTSGRPLGIDSAIILVQAALERLAHHHAVVDRKMISAKGFKDLKPASDKLRMLFSSLKIPSEITGDTPDIQREAVQRQWVDAPHAITDIRNWLVHPDSKRPVGVDCYYDAWRLSLWYLELTILAMCGYDGTYQNRLKPTDTGQVRHVPWKNTLE